MKEDVGLGCHPVRRLPDANATNVVQTAHPHMHIGDSPHTKYAQLQKHVGVGVIRSSVSTAPQLHTHVSMHIWLNFH